MKYKAGTKKRENHPVSLQAKVQLRRHVLEQVKPARVLDLFCGHRTLWREVWQYAERYAACDAFPWTIAEAPRFACDNRRLLRSLDLSAFNVFDLDAFGSPWEQVVILAARRRWAPGELGAVVITDGSTLKTRWGALPNALRVICGFPDDKIAPTVAGAEELRRLAIAGFAKRAGVKIRKQWEAIGPAPAQLYYAAIIFEGWRAEGGETETARRAEDAGRSGRKRRGKRPEQGR